MLLECTSESTFLKEKVSNVGLILKALNSILQIVLLQSIFFMIGVLNLINLCKSSFPNFLNNIIASYFFLSSILATLF